MILLTILKFIWGALTGKEGKNAQIAGIILIGIVVIAVFGCGLVIRNYVAPSKLENQIEDRKPEIIQTEANSASKTEEVNRAGQTSSQAQKHSTEAEKRADEAVNKDSSEYANTNAGQRFCERFPNDSTCTK